MSELLWVEPRAPREPLAIRIARTIHHELWMRIWAPLRYGPSCGAEPPADAPGAGPCVIRRRGHLRWPNTHADGTGWVWNDHGYHWMGPDE